MIRKVKRFFALPPEEKRLFLESCVILAFMWAAILTVPFKQLTCSLHHSKKTIAPGTVTDRQLHTAQRIGKVITHALGSTPWKSSCLVQTLAAQRMLKKRDIPGMFFLGVKKGTTVAETMEAHAWLQFGDCIITGERGHETYAVLSVFAWDSND